MRHWVRSATLLAALLALGLGVLRPGTAWAATSPLTTVSVVAHADDDLLFLNPDVLSDVRAGYTVWTIYLTDGRRDGNPARNDTSFTNARIEGVRAAYAAMAGVPDRWTFAPLDVAGHQVATNHLEGTRVNLAFLFVRVAANCCESGDPFGDLFRLLHDPGYVAWPSDGRAPYTRDGLVATLSGLLDTIGPHYVRSLSALGHRGAGLALDHCDHTASAIITGLADSDARSLTVRPRYEYWGYRIRTLPDNRPRVWHGPKYAAWQAYVPHHPGLPGPEAWSYGLLARSYVAPDGVHLAGSPWTPPADFASCPDRAGEPVSWAWWNAETHKEERSDAR